LIENLFLNSTISAFYNQKILYFCQKSPSLIENLKSKNENFLLKIYYANYYG